MRRTEADTARTPAVLPYATPGLERPRSPFWIFVRVVAALVGLYSTLLVVAGALELVRAMHMSPGFGETGDDMREGIGLIAIGMVLMYACVRTVLHRRSK